jgi:ribosomal RNA-processing protein 9
MEVEDHLVDDFLVESEDGTDASDSENGDEEEQLKETAEERRVRLAKEFISRVSEMEEKESESEASETDEEVDHVQSRLKKAVSKEKGTLHRKISRKVSFLLAALSLPVFTRSA